MQPDRWFGVGAAEGFDAGAPAAGDALRRDGGAKPLVREFQSQVPVALPIA
jgi:hypothetical protein